MYFKAGGCEGSPETSRHPVPIFEYLNRAPNPAGSLMRAGYRLILATIVCTSLNRASTAQTVEVLFEFEDGVRIVQREVPVGMSPLEAAVRAHVAGPTAQEAAMGLSSPFAPGTQIVSLQI